MTASLTIPQSASSKTGRPQRAEPSDLRQSGSGYFYCLLPGNGKKSFGSDPKAAKLLHHVWRESWDAENGAEPATPEPVRQNLKKMPATKGSKVLQVTGSGGRVIMDRPQSATSSVSVRQVADSLFLLVQSESPDAGYKNIKLRTKRFLDKFGSRPIDSLTPDDLIGFKSELSRSKSPEYTNNCLSAVRRVLVFAFETGKVSQPFRLGLIFKNVPKGAIKRKGIPLENLKTLLKAVAAENLRARQLACRQGSRFSSGEAGSTVNSRAVGDCRYDSPRKAAQ